MIVLKPTQKLQIVLAAGTTTTAPQVSGAFFDQNAAGQETKWAPIDATTNGTTDVDLCTAPPQDAMRCVRSLSITNLDTVSHTATIKKDVSGTDSFVGRLIIPASRTGYYKNGNWGVT